MTAAEVFPFEYVKNKSRVIIYGLGNYGNSYIEQIQVTNWCKIVGITDSYCLKKVERYPFYSLDELESIDADYIVIAVKAEMAVNQIYNQLIKHGIPDSKIVSALRRTNWNYEYVDEETKKNNKLRVLLQASGGLGDCVVCLSVYERIVGILEKIEIDIQCRKAYGEALYGSNKKIHSIIDEEVKVDHSSYDLILHLAHGIKVVKHDEEQCTKYSRELSYKIRLLEKDSFRASNNMDYDYEIQIRKACIKGWDRYRALGHGDILNLSADMVKVGLLEQYLPEYSKLCLGKYITVNYGADTAVYKKKMQTKVWPYRYYEQFVSMFKMQYPEYEIVQLGSNDTKQIMGVDRYIKGKSLELVKYILKNSALHFDCEGGLVHLATALGTKCAVVFGPTPLEYYAYPQNINITAGKCHNCMHLLNNWYIECLRGEEEPECMYGITPEMVFNNISGYLDQII